MLLLLHLYECCLYSYGMCSVGNGSGTGPLLALDTDRKSKTLARLNPDVDSMDEMMRRGRLFPSSAELSLKRHWLLSSLHTRC